MNTFIVDPELRIQFIERISVCRQFTVPPPDSCPSDRSFGYKVLPKSLSSEGLVLVPVSIKKNLPSWSFPTPLLVLHLKFLSLLFGTPI